MNFKILEKNIFYIKINKSYKNIDLSNIDDVIKKFLVTIRKRYGFNIFGFYEVKIFDIKNLATILLFKKNSEDSFYNNVDLKIDKKVKLINIKTDDFILDKDFNNLDNNKRIYRICEHYYFNQYNLQ